MTILALMATRLAVPVLFLAVWPSCAETPIEVRLLTPVSSYNAKVGRLIEARLATPLCASSIRIAPQGTIVRGTVSHVHRVGLGIVHESARLDLHFQEIRFPDGRSYPMEARLLAVDSARERVDRHGSIRGIRATAALSNRLGERLAFAAMGNPLVIVPAFAVTSAMFRFPEPEIEYAEGTELYLEASFPESLGELGACALPQPASDAVRAELASLVDSVPQWSYSKRQVQPMDPVNLIYIGSADELQDAFEAAGWSRALGGSVVSGMTAIRAVAEQRPYTNAPMRTLRLGGNDPDFTFQKSLNTFAKRHHLRVWKRAAAFHGLAVWASAATKDVAATFSMRPFGFTHEIENDVDAERDKVVSDLVFAGCVAWVSFVERGPGRDGARYRKGINTDSRVAVVGLKGCQATPKDPSGEVLKAGPGSARRVVRRVLLTGRNHLLRDNIVWRSADAGRLGWTTLRKWRAGRADERRAREAARLWVAPPASAARVVLGEPPEFAAPSAVGSAELQLPLAYPRPVPQAFAPAPLAETDGQ